MSSPRKAKKSLTNEEKNQMVQEYKSTKISQRDLADKYDVSKTLVQKVLKEEKESVEDIPETIDCDGSSSSLQNFDSLEDLDKFIESKEQEIDHSVVNVSDADIGAGTSMIVENNQVKQEFHDNQMSNISAVPDEISEDEKFALAVEGYIAFKNFEYRKILEERDMCKKELQSEKNKTEQLIRSWGDGQKQIHTLLKENQSLRVQLQQAQLLGVNLQKKKSHSCAFCESDSKFRFRTMAFCSNECVRNTLAALNPK